SVLAEQDHVAPRRDDHAHVQPLLLAMREIARGIVRAPDQSDAGEDAIHSLLSLARARPLGKGGEPYVFLNRKFPVDARHLQLDADSTLRPLMRQEPRDRAALQQDLALGRPGLAAH